MQFHQPDSDTSALRPGLIDSSVAPQTWPHLLKERAASVWPWLAGQLAAWGRAPLASRLLLRAPAFEPAVAAEREAAIEEALDAFEAWASLHPGQAVELGLSGNWLLCHVEPQATSALALKEVAAAHWAHYQGLDAVQLQQDWVSVALPQSGLKLLCAMPAGLLVGLKEVARAHRLRLQAVMPWWAQGLQQALASKPPAAPAKSPVEGQPQTCEWVWREPDGQCVAQAQWRDGGWMLHTIWSERCQPIDFASQAWGDPLGGTRAQPCVDGVATALPCLWALEPASAQAYSPLGSSHA